MPCASQEFGWWHGGYRCYAREALQPPEFTNAIWEGRTHGVIMECTYPGTTSPAVWFWAPSSDSSVVPDARQLAEQAVERMRLEAIRIGSVPKTTDKHPGSMGIVGFNVWLWVDNPSPSTWGPITKSASAGGYTVTATAEVDRVVWDMGNGDVVTCGKGTRHVGDLHVEDVSPTCGYTYLRDGDYDITATTFWNVDWQGIGQSGTISFELERSGQITIAEVQVLNIAPGN